MGAPEDACQFSTLAPQRKKDAPCRGKETCRSSQTTPGPLVSRAFVEPIRGFVMNSFRLKGHQEREEPDARLASPSEIRAAFEQEHDYLNWIALLVSGDILVARKSIVDARGLAEIGSGVSSDWLMQWAHMATARIAARSLGRLNEIYAARYAHLCCEHTDHDFLSFDQVSALRKVDPLQIVADLDPIARAVLVLHGVLHISISDCALLLNLPRGSVNSAYCHVLQRTRELESVNGLSGTRENAPEPRRPDQDECVKPVSDR